MKKDCMHLKAPGNWINDPNGFIYYKGKYHVFYQHFPYAPVWGTMHWGHAVSEDLVHWEHMGIALFPTRYEDQNGCFSGSAIEHDGRMYLYYTGIHYYNPNPDNIHLCLNDDFAASQLMIASEDGFHFDNFGEKKTVLPPILNNQFGHRTHTRDPKVWRGEDAWYMVLGSSTADRRGQLLFYKSENLTDWTFVNTVSKEKNFGWMWECPDYFEVNGGKILIFSPMGVLQEAPLEENHTICMPVAFDEKTCSMEIPDDYQYLDYGLDLYAPQTTLDEDGRRVLLAWLRMPEAVDNEWCGMFCLPRVVEYKDGHIYFRVHPHIENRYTKKITRAALADATGYRVSFDLEDGQSAAIGGYRISRQNNRIYTDRSAVFPRNEKFRAQASTPPVKEGCHLDVYVGDHIIETFVNRGEYVITNAVYGLTDEIDAEDINGLTIYTLE